MGKYSTLELETSTLMGREEAKKLATLLQGIIDSPDSLYFRDPVDWKGMGLLDYPNIIQRPMDLSTTKKKLGSNTYHTVEDCLDEIQLIWDNCKTYNPKDSWIHKQAEKLEKVFKKMIKNYLPFVVTVKAKKDNKKKQEQPPVVPGKQSSPEKKALPVPTVVATQPPPAPTPAETEHEKNFIAPRTKFIARAVGCSQEQMGLLLLLVKKSQPEAVSVYNGAAKIDMDVLSAQVLQRLMSQLDMWGVGLEPSTTKKNK